MLVLIQKIYSYKIKELFNEWSKLINSYSVFNDSNYSDQVLPSSVLYTGDQMRDSSDNLTSESMAICDEIDSSIDGSLILCNLIDGIVPPSLVIKSKFRESRSNCRNIPFE